MILGAFANLKILGDNYQIYQKYLHQEDITDTRKALLMQMGTCNNHNACLKAQ